MTEEACTELVMVPWPNAFTKWADEQPITLLRAWQMYYHERVLRLGQDAQRMRYVIRDWCRIMGIDALPGTWKRADVQRYTDTRLSEGKHPATVRRELTLMRAALSHNVKFERLERIPYFEKPEGEGQKRRPLTEEEYARVMRQFMPRRIRLFFLLAYWTGHRSRAIEELTWDRVNWAARTLDFNIPGKRRTSKRRVDGFPIPDELMPRLEAAYAHPLRDTHVIGLGPNGACSTTYHQCKDVLRAAGIDERGVCRHTIRKLFVTERIKAGGNPEKVAALIADNPQTMRKHYSILGAEDLRSTANLRAA